MVLHVDHSTDELLGDVDSVNLRTTLSTSNRCSESNKPERFLSKKQSSTAVIYDINHHAPQRIVAQFPMYASPKNTVMYLFLSDSATLDAIEETKRRDGDYDLQTKVKQARREAETRRTE